MKTIETFEELVLEYGNVMQEIAVAFEWGASQTSLRKAERKLLDEILETYSELLGELEK